VADQLRAGLHDADRVALAAVADRQIRQEEFVDQLADRRVVVRGNRAIEVHRGLRDEVEHGRRVHRHAQRLVGRGVDFSGRQAAEIGEAVAEAAADRHHVLDLAHTVLEADQVGAALGQPFEHVGVKLGVRAVVDDHAHVRHGLADFFGVRRDAFLAGFGQVVGHQQNAVRAVTFGFLGIRDCDAGRAAGAGENRYLAFADFGCRTHDVRVVVMREREEFARAAGDEQRRGAVRREPFEALGIGVGAEIALFVEVGNGEGQKAFRNDLLQFLRCRHDEYPGRRMGSVFRNGDFLYVIVQQQFG
jgi:hypothetical protein